MQKNSHGCRLQNTSHSKKNSSTIPRYPSYPTPPQKENQNRKALLQKDYVYDAYYDCYLCPENQVLDYKTTDRQGYRQYKSDKEICKNCPNLSMCTQSKTIKK